MWLYLLWWLVICNGSTALAVATLNRLHGYALPEWFIRLSHRIHILLFVTVPVFTLISTGWYGPRLLRGGNWYALPVGWWLAFAVAAISTSIFWISVIRRHLRRCPRQQLSITSQRRDIAEELGSLPI